MEYSGQHSINHIVGGMLGGFGRFTLMLGALRVLGRGALGPTRDGIVTAGWVGIVPGRLIVVAFPGLASSVFLKVWDGGASAVREIMFYPLMMTSPRVLLICFCCPVLLALVILYSSVSASTMFMCLSKAKKVPTIILPSWMVILTLKSIHCRNLLLWVVIIFIIDLANHELIFI